MQETSILIISFSLQNLDNRRRALTSRFRSASLLVHIREIRDGESWTEGKDLESVVAEFCRLTAASSVAIYQ